ncbi:MAG: SDR family NAD(P)-dependent oxidoreductase [Caldilineaceae bacterium]
MPHLPAGQVDYTFTDISATFLRQAQTAFADYDFVHYRTLDIEQAPSAQGFAPQGYDVVIAANVLHATQDLATALQHIRQLLAPNGLLLLLEGTARSRWIDLTFGLTEGWWRFADARQEHPLVEAAAWRKLLLANGFTDIADRPATAVEPTLAGGQTLILARADAQINREVTGPAQPWLLFADTGGCADALAGQLRSRGADVFLVDAGERYHQRDAQHFTVNPYAASDYATLFATLPPIGGIAHLWSLDLPDLADGIVATNGTHDHTTLHPGDDLVALTQQSVGSVLTLVQALLQSKQSPHNLWLVTQNAQPVLDSDGVAGALQATLWGLGRTLALEHPELNPVQIDLDGDTQHTQQWTALAALMTTSSITADQENQLALRQGQCYVARLAHADTQSAADIDTLPIQPNATYLITGGLGDIGLLTAEWLVSQGANHLVLVGRRQPRAAATERLVALREQGVTVTVHQADVTDRSQMAQVLTAIDPAAPLRGLIHSVGVLDDGVLIQQHWERFAQVLAPKLQGAWHLHDLTQGMRLDFFVLFSSAVGLMGNAGQANHAAANTFLDAFAHYRRAQGQPALSINWGVCPEIGGCGPGGTESNRSAAQGRAGDCAPAGIAAFCPPARCHQHPSGRDALAVVTLLC